MTNQTPPVDKNIETLSNVGKIISNHETVMKCLKPTTKTYRYTTDT